MKKTLHIIIDAAAWLLVILAVCMTIFTVVSVNVFDRNNRRLFGYQAFIVRSDSMSATDFSAGDVVFTKSVDPSTLSPGDIIAFTSQNPYNEGETVTHKIRKLAVNEKGERGFVTFGTTKNVDDETIVTYPYVLGEYKGCVPNLGNFFVFLKTVPGYILCIFLPFLLLIIYQIINCVKLFQRYKKEQTAGIEAEKAAIARERAKNAETLRQLRELKESLESRSASVGAARGGSRPDEKSGLPGSGTPVDGSGPREVGNLWDDGE